MHLNCLAEAIEALVGCTLLSYHHRTEQVAREQKGQWKKEGHCSKCHQRSGASQGCLQCAVTRLSQRRTSQGIE